MQTGVGPGVVASVFVSSYELRSVYLEGLVLVSSMPSGSYMLLPPVKSQTWDKHVSGACSAYQSGPGHQVLLASLSPYLLQGMVAFPTPYLNLLQSREWTALTPVAL